jgi:hypothetical protein
MRAFDRLPSAYRRFLIGAFALYLFGLLGYLGTSHSHAADKGHARAHAECQLCQISAQTYVAADPGVCPESPAVPVLVVEEVWEPILASRFQPFASRAPPSA